MGKNINHVTYVIRTINGRKKSLITIEGVVALGDNEKELLQNKEAVFRKLRQKKVKHSDIEIVSIEKFKVTGESNFY